MHKYYRTVKIVHKCIHIMILINIAFLSQATAAETSVETGVDRFKKPMPTIEPIAEDKFLAETQEFKTVPYGDKSLAYSIRWPASWTIGEDKGSSNFELNTKLFTSINIWFSPPRMGGQSRIEVKAVDLQFQLTAEQWFLQNILESGQTLEGLTVHDDTKVEGLMIIMEEDITYYVRSMTIINGKRVIQAQYYVPMFFWNDEKAMQAQCLSTFQITYPSEAQIENMLSFQFLDVAEVKYPESWRVTAKPLRSVEKMNVKFLNIRQTKVDIFKTEESIEGQIDATLVSTLTSDSLLYEIDEYKKNLEGTGMLVGKKIENRDDYKYNTNFSFALTEVYEGIDSTNDAIEYELWFSVLVSGNYYYFITLLTPSRNEAFFDWARNTQTYKQIVQGTIPSAGGFIDKGDDL